jgi:hypothetical protein
LFEENNIEKKIYLQHPIILRSHKKKTEQGKPEQAWLLFPLDYRWALGNNVISIRSGFETFLQRAGFLQSTRFEKYPKFKNGEKIQISKYRPISLIPKCSKVCEKIVLKRLLDHCSINNLLIDNQHL